MTCILPVWPASDPDKILGSMQYRRWKDSKTHGQISHFAMSFLIGYVNGVLSSGDYAIIIRLEDLNLCFCFSIISRWRCPRVPWHAEGNGHRDLVKSKY
jgi:hypothetical protein